MTRRLGRLFKQHNRCTNRKDEACDCAWRGRYGPREVTLARWLGEPVDPRSRRAGELALARLVSAIVAKTFHRTGAPPASTAGTFAAFIDEWQFHYADREGQQQTSTGLRPMLGVLKQPPLGSMALADMPNLALDIERALDALAKARHWKPKTWNQYHALMFTICKRATLWKVGGKPKLASNPLADIPLRRAEAPEHFKVRIEEPLEDKLFAVVRDLNRVQHGPNTRGKLTQAKADAIRAAVAGGQRQKDVAQAFGVSASVVSAIVVGDIWNPAKYRVGTKGTEMERRLIAAFDGGLRRGEMLLIQMKHVDWKLVRFDGADGSVVTAYVLTLPPSVTKGGKSSGKPERVYAATPRFRTLLEQRRFQLKHKPEAYIFGTESGHRQLNFRRMWHDLFDLAGIRWGRNEGVVWHSIRHEYCSRIAELTKDPVITKELARHQSLETTELYMAAREHRKLAAAASLSRLSMP
jgi:integrase